MNQEWMSKPMNEECVHSWGNKEGNVMRVRAPWFTREGGSR